MPARRRRKRVFAAVLVTAMFGGLPAGFAAAQTEPPPTQSPTPTPSPEVGGTASSTGGDASDPLVGAPETYRLRARVRLGPDGGSTRALELPRAIRAMRSRACRRVASILWDHEPRRSVVRVTLFRQSGTPDATRSDVPQTGCQSREERKSAFRLPSRVAYPGPDGRVTRGPMRLRNAVRILTERANSFSDDVLQRGITPTLVLRLGSRAKTVRGMIVGLARRYRLPVTKSVSVARCESRLQPRARSAYYGGVYQQAYSYWPSRARRFGHPGESIFNPYANIDVSLRMARAHGWGHWGCA
jgi:hypothetical protein